MIMLSERARHRYALSGGSKNTNLLGGRLGSARKSLLDSSVLHLAPATSHGAPVVGESLLVVLLAMVLWLVVPAGLGAWRTRTMDA